MKLPLFYLLCIFLLMCVSVKGQGAHTTISFININRKDFSYWCGPVPSNAKYRLIQFGYESHEHGWARIIFYPKTIKRIKIIDSVEKSNKYNDSWVKSYVLKNRNSFNIWMVFIDKIYDKDKPDAGDLTVFEPTYPCKAELYKLDNSKWTLVKSKQIIKEGDEFKLFPTPDY